MMGYISSNMLQKFLKDQCGFLLQDTELKLMLSRYDRDKDYRISREEFKYQVHFSGEGKHKAEKPAHQPTAGQLAKNGARVQ